MARAGVTRAAVIDAALAVVDTDGWAALSLPPVAQALGVKVPSLYKHVDGLPGLRQAVATAAITQLADVMTAATMGRSDADALRALAHAYRDFASSKPGRYAATIAAPSAEDAPHLAAATRALTAVMAVVRGYELDESASVHAIRSVRAALHGFVSLEAAGGFGMPEDVNLSFMLMLDDLDTLLRARGRSNVG